MSERVEIKRRVEIGKERIIFLIDNVSGLKLSFFFSTICAHFGRREPIWTQTSSHTLPI